MKKKRVSTKSVSSGSRRMQAKTERRLERKRARKEFLGVDELPGGSSGEKVTDCCLVLEGGAFRGVYQEGVLDVFLQENLNASCVIGVSAGALNGMNYVAGQVGRSARANLKYRHDPRYVGRKALRRNQGLIGFDFLFQTYNEGDPLDRERFFRKEQRFIAVATNCRTGKAEYFEKDSCSDIFQAIRASASLPYLSKMVPIDGVPYLDGGCSCKLAYQWALHEGYEKIIVIRTRPESFRYSINEKDRAVLPRRFYRSYPGLTRALAVSDRKYNHQCDELERLRDKGRILMISPSVRVEIGRLEGNMQKLGAWYYLGCDDAHRRMKEIREYLEK